MNRSSPGEPLQVATRSEASSHRSQDPACSSLTRIHAVCGRVGPHISARRLRCVPHAAPISAYCPLQYALTFWSLVSLGLKKVYGGRPCGAVGLRFTGPAGPGTVQPPPPPHPPPFLFRSIFWGCPFVFQRLFKNAATMLVRIID